MPTKVGVTARAIAKDYTGPDFSLTEEQINAADFLAKSNLPAYIINPDGDRIEVDGEKFNAFLSGTQKTTSVSDSPAEITKPITPPSSDAERQIRHLQSEGMTQEQIAEVMRPGSASIGSVSNGTNTSPVITPTHHQQVTEVSENRSQHTTPALSKFVAAQGESIRRDLEYRASVGGPSLRHDFFGWSNYQADRFVFNPIRRAFGRPERTPETHSYEGGRVSRLSPGSEIGYQSHAGVGPAPQTTNQATLSSSTVSDIATADNHEGPVVSTGSPSSGQSQGAYQQKNTTAERQREGHRLETSSKSGLKNGVRGAISGQFNNLKNNALGQVAGAKKWLDRGIKAIRAAGGDVVAAAQLLTDVDMWKSIWNAVKKYLPAGLAGLILGPLLWLYGMVAPFLAALTPGALIGGAIGGLAGLALFPVLGPLGPLAGMAIGAAIGANWLAITAGISNFFGGLAGLGGSVAAGLGSFGGAIFAAPASAIGFLSAVTVGIATFLNVQQQAVNLSVWGSGGSSEIQKITVEKTATPSIIKNDESGSIVYKITIANDTGTDVKVTVRDRDVKVYGKAAPKTIVMPNPTTPLPVTISKDNDSNNPYEIIYSPLSIPPTVYNDSQIVNTVTVETEDSQTQQKQTYTAQATVQIGNALSDPPYGYPFGGPITSMDDQLICVEPGSRPITDYDRANCGTDNNGNQLVYKAHCGEVGHSGDGGSTACLPGGLDIAGRGNVLSSTTGVVTYSRFDLRLGGVVYVDSIDSKTGASYRAAFLHLNKDDLHPLGPIARGEKIGSIYDKSTPLTYETGFHLHYQVVKNGTNVYFADYNQSKNGLSLIGPCLDENGRTANVRPVAPLLDKPGDVSYAIAPRVNQNVTCVK